ncbi:hypothetical protein F3157_10465 [Virgibacillus dakarensis]|nr:hypothetical protein [Virgibacillus dakarensis]MTW86078.1 hypothetical protein [Virgibacillus dakarensis]
MAIFIEITLWRNKGASARLAKYKLRPAKQGGSVLLPGAAVLTEHSYEGDKGSLLQL